MSKTKRLFEFGFTLMELMVVVVIIGIIAAFGIPNYQKSIQKAHERDMLAQLTMIHAANVLYRSYNGNYWSGLNQDLAAINTNLSLNIIANGASYVYDGDGTTFTATATWDTCDLSATEAPIDSSNPCRASGAGTCVSVLSAC